MCWTSCTSFALAQENLTMIDLLEIRDAKPQLSGRRDMSGLTVKQILAGIVVELFRVCRNALRIAFPDGWRSLLTPFFLNGLQFNGVHRHGICSYQEEPRWIDELLGLRQRSSMPDLAGAIHDVQNSFRAQGFYRTHDADERIGEGVGRLMGTSHVIKRAVTKVFQTTRDSGGRVVLHGGNVDDLGEFLGDQTRHIRPRLPLPKKTCLAIDVCIVPGGVQLAVLDADNIYSRRKQSLVAADVHFVSVAVKNDDVARRNASGLQSLDDLSNDLRRGAASRRARGIDLDSDHIRRCNEFGPGSPAGRLAREFLHSPFEHLTDNGLRHAIAHDGATIGKFDDSAGEQPRHAEGRWLAP